MAIRYSKKLTIRMSPPVRGTYSVSISHNGRALWSGEIGYGFKPSVGEEANSPHTYDRLAGLALIDASASADVEPLTERTAAAGWQYPISRRMGGPIVNGKRRAARSNPRAAEMDMPAPRRLRNHTIKIIATNLPADAKVMHGGRNIIHDPLPDGSPARRSAGRTMFGFDYAPRVSQAFVVVAGRSRLTFDIDPRRIVEDPSDGSSVFVIPMDFGMVRANPAVACSPNKKRDKYRAAKVMHKGEWVQNDGCWDAKGVPSYVGKGESGKRRVIAKKVVRQKASRTPSRVKGVRARKRS